MYKNEKDNRFWLYARRICVQLEAKYYENGKVVKSEEFMIIFDFQSRF